MKKLAIAFLHTGYWAMYLMVVTIMIALLNINNTAPLGSGHYLKVMFLTPFGMASIFPAVIGFYSFYTLVFNYLSQKKIASLFLSAILISLLSSICTQLIMYFALQGKYVSWNPSTCIFMGLFLSFIACVNGILALVMKGFINWYVDIKVKVELNKKNHEMELALMKAQINPHFLFNTINNIDVLIQKDAVKASEYLNKLSDIMRFMLYETKSEKIALTKELSYIEKYIELQRIRTTNTNYVKYDVKGEAGNLLIEPMLFIPFMENAFKHSENKKVENAIKVSFDIGKDSIRFECENAYSKETSTKPEHSGLGNELIKRRLALLYPDKHTFETEDKNGMYKVILVLSI